MSQKKSRRIFVQIEKQRKKARIEKAKKMIDELKKEIDQATAENKRNLQLKKRNLEAYISAQQQAPIG